MNRLALFAAVVVVALAGVAVFVLRHSGSAPVRLSTARFRDGFSLRYPSAWTRIDWCQSGMHVQPIAVLTSTRPGPKCDPKSNTVSWPPSAEFAANDVFVALSAVGPPLWRSSNFKSNARIGGQPAYLEKSAYGSDPDCGVGTRSEGRAAEVVPPGWTGGFLNVQAVICGPHLAAGEAAVRDLFASIRFSGNG